MNEILKIVLSLSFSGSLLILVLLFCKPLMKNRISKRWQYYIWLVVIARLLLPFSPETSFVGTLFEEIDRSGIVRTDAPPPAEQGTALVPQPANDTAIDGNSTTQGGESIKSAALTPRAVLTYIIQNLWLVWLVVALILLIRKITIYQGFVRYIKAGRAEVSDTAILDKLALIGEQAGVKAPVELYTNSLIASPLLLGFFRPCIVLPTVDLPDSDLQYILLHELTHYRRRDMFYKWLVQLTVCLHWFSPFAYLMGREVSRACELACDEAVIRKLDTKGQRDYGDTLLSAIVMGGDYKDSVASMTLNESKELLKERLEAIMTFHEAKKWMIPAAILFSICLCVGSFLLGAYMGQPILKKAPMEQTVFSDEGLPIMNAQNRALYERYLDPIAVTGILYRNFSPEDVSALLEDGSAGLLNLVAVLEGEKLREYSQDGKLSAAFAEEVLTKYFPLRADSIRSVCADIYDAQSDTYYYPGGLGGGPFVPIVTGSTTVGRLTTLYYTAYVGDPASDTFQYTAGISGEMVIEVNGDDFKYLSNQSISQIVSEEAVTVQPTSTKIAQTNTAQNQNGNWNFLSYAYLDGYMIGIGSRAQDDLQNYSNTTRVTVKDKEYTVTFYEQAKLYSEDDPFIKALRVAVADVIAQGWRADRSSGSFLIVNQVIAGKTAEELYGYFYDQGDPIALQSLTPHVKKEVVEQHITKAYDDNNEMIMLLILTELPADFAFNADDLARRAISDGRQTMYFHLSRFVSPAVRKELDEKLFGAAGVIPEIDAVVNSYNFKHPNSNEYKKASHDYNYSRLTFY